MNMAQVDLPDEIKESIATIVDYNWSDEAEDFDENCKASEEDEEPECDPDCHIFTKLQQVSEWLESL
jgi:hypothetical protein